MTQTIDAAPRAKPLIAIAKWLLCGIVLAFVAAALVKQFKQVRWEDFHFRALPFAAATLCILGVSAMQLAARWTLLAAYGYPLNWRVQLAAAWVPQLGKYLPGGIASVAGSVYLLRKRGVPGAVALSVAMLLDALAVIVGLVVSTPLLLWPPIREKLPFVWLACALLIAIGLVMLHPRVFVSCANFLLRKFGRQPIENGPTLRRYAWPLLASFGQWIFAGLAIYLMTTSVTPVDARLLLLFIGSAALAMTVSYLTPFAPGGIGVREGLYLLTLGPVIGPAVAIVVVAMRIAQTIIEIVLAGLGLALIKKIN